MLYIDTCWHFLRARRSRILQVCRRNCSDICHTVGDISTSGLDGHIAISSCPSMSHLFVYAFFEFGVVESFVYRAGITVIVILQIYSVVWVTAVTMRLRFCPSSWKCTKYRSLYSCLVLYHFLSLTFKKCHICEVCIFASQAYNAVNRKNESRGRYIRTGHVKPEVDTMIFSVVSESPRGL